MTPGCRRAVCARARGWPRGPMPARRHAIACGVGGEPIPLMTVTSEERLHLTPVVPAASSGSKELAEGVAGAGATAPPDTPGMLLARHGLIALGASVQQARDVAGPGPYTARISIPH